MSVISQFIKMRSSLYLLRIFPERYQKKPPENGTPKPIREPKTDARQPKEALIQIPQPSILELTSNEDANRILLYMVATALPHCLCKSASSSLSMSGHRLADAVNALRHHERLVSCISIPTALQGKRPLAFVAQPALYELLGLSTPKALSIGKGELTHRCIQHLIAYSLENSKVEHNLGGKCIDVVYQKDGKLCGLEVQTTNSHLIENIRKDFEAGLHHLTVLFTSAQLLKTARAAVKRALIKGLLTPVNLENLALDSVGNWI